MSGSTTCTKVVWCKAQKERVWVVITQIGNISKWEVLEIRLYSDTRSLTGCKQWHFRGLKRS